MDVDAAGAVTPLFAFLLSAAGVLGLAWYLQSNQWVDAAFWRAEGTREAGSAGRGEATGGGEGVVAPSTSGEAGGKARGETGSDG